MSEEDNGSQENQQQVVEPTAIELQAIESGWRPKDEFDGDPAKWVEADEFIRRAPLFDKIDVVGKELKEAKKVIKDLLAREEKIRLVEYTRGMEDLRAQKKQAYDDGEVDKIIEIDEKIAEHKANEATAKLEQKTQARQPDPVFVQWVTSNKWYSNDERMTEVADQVGLAYKASNPHLSTEEVLSYVDQRIKAAFPDKFKNPAKSRPAAVEGSVSNGKQSKEDDYPLSDADKQVMNRLIRSGHMTKEQYIAELKAYDKVKGIK